MNDEVVVNRLIIPHVETEILVSQAGNIYLRECPCRLQMQVCPKEKWEVCILFEHASEEDRQKARLISSDEALEIVKATTARGDIHQVFYFEEGERPFELCNCCSCCCYPLREARDKDDGFEGQLRTGYIAVTDMELCAGCGDCVDACFFRARELKDFILEVDDALCYGCGVCIPECPEEAIVLMFQPDRGVRIPGFN